MVHIAADTHKAVYHHVPRGGETPPTRLCCVWLDTAQDNLDDLHIAT